MADETPGTPATPVASSVPVTAESAGAAPGPAAGTSPPEAVAPEATPPAADLSSTAPAEAPDPLAKSLLGEAKAGETEEPAPEAPQPAEPPPAPTYEAFALPEGVRLADDQVGKFTGLLGEYEQRIAATPADAHAATQELGQKLIDFYIAEQQNAQQRFARLQRDNWQRTIDGWVTQFREDREIGSNRQDTTLQRCAAMIDLYGGEVGAEHAQALRDVMTLTGAGNNPELIRFVNWAAGHAVETARMVAASPRPMSVGQTKATRLYRNSIPGAA